MLVSLNRKELGALVSAIDCAYSESSSFSDALKIGVKILKELIRVEDNPEMIKYFINKMKYWLDEIEQNKKYQNPDDGYDAFGVNTQNSFNTPPN